MRVRRSTTCHETVVPSHAKVNLGLWILGRRPDGFHEIDTILQTIDLDDELLIARSRVRGCRLTTVGRAIPPGPLSTLPPRALPWASLASRLRRSPRPAHLALDSITISQHRPGRCAGLA
jgi:hypothetical protein